MWKYTREELSEMAKKPVLINFSKLILEKGNKIDCDITSTRADGYLYINPPLMKLDKIEKIDIYDKLGKVKKIKTTYLAHIINDILDLIQK